MWVVASRSCSDCGGELSVAVFAHKPSEEERNGVEKALGGMWCIHTWTFEAELDGNPVIKEVE